MPGAFDPVQLDGQWSTLAGEIAPPTLGVRQVCGDLKFVAPTVVSHRGAYRAPGAAPRVGDDRDIAADHAPEEPRVRQRRDRHVEQWGGTHHKSHVGVDVYLWLIFVDGRAV